MSRQAGVQRGYLWTTTCTEESYEWNGGSGCYQWIGQQGAIRDTYSVYIGGNSITRVYSNPSCGGSYAGDTGYDLCHHRNGNSIKSFRVQI
ncbi:hypothetical protein QBC44DRAFT_371548 [Cladorrhinum sp. PSN332]|nr:hypothetical protein QBC44DRAFT_371548 [Cladorrhinum sp. PSN332]